MSLNHHILAKTTTDAVLARFKSAAWTCLDGIGTDFSRIPTTAEFPSPDAAFFDWTHKIQVSFEFKPPTETKRGILTGVGQSIAYLNNANISFLVAPRRLEEFDLGSYLIDLYRAQIVGKIPTGLILYDNNKPQDVVLEHNVSMETLGADHKVFSAPRSNRFWANYVDMPVPLLHLLLHYFYLKKVGQIEGDAFAACWRERMIPPSVVESLRPCPILDVEGNPIKTPANNKNMIILEKTIPKLVREYEPDEVRLRIEEKRDTTISGDTLFQSQKKNFVTFLKHLQLIDSEGSLTDSGFSLYHLGLVNGPTSQAFRNYVTKEILITGHHLDLILDLDTIKQTSDKESDIWGIMQQQYEERGLLKKNPGRIAHEESNSPFLKDERILWNALGLVDNTVTIQWRKITEICSLPDLQ